MADGAIIGLGHYRSGVKTLATTNNTEQTLASVTLPTGTEGLFEGRAIVVGRRYDAGGAGVMLAKTMLLIGAINGGAASASEATLGIYDESGLTTYQATIDTSSGDVRLRVTGAVGHSVRWVGGLEVYPREQELGFGG